MELPSKDVLSRHQEGLLAQLSGFLKAPTILALIRRFAHDQKSIRQKTVVEMKSRLGNAANLSDQELRTQLEEDTRRVGQLIIAGESPDPSSIQRSRAISDFLANSGPLLTEVSVIDAGLEGLDKAWRGNDLNLLGSIVNVMRAGVDALTSVTSQPQGKDFLDKVVDEVVAQKPRKLPEPAEVAVIIPKPKGNKPDRETPNRQAFGVRVFLKELLGETFEISHGEIIAIERSITPFLESELGRTPSVPDKKQILTDVLHYQTPGQIKRVDALLAHIEGPVAQRMIVELSGKLGTKIPETQVQLHPQVVEIQPERTEPSVILPAVPEKLPKGPTMPALLALIQTDEKGMFIVDGPDSFARQFLTFMGKKPTERTRGPQGTRRQRIEIEKQDALANLGQEINTLLAEARRTRASTIGELLKKVDHDKVPHSVIKALRWLDISGESTEALRHLSVIASSNRSIRPSTRDELKKLIKRRGNS